MKYLKKYNESIFDNLSDIKKVTLVDLASWGKEPENLTASEVDKFKKYFLEIGVPVRLSVYEGNIFRTKLVINPKAHQWLSQKKISDIRIYKYEDEYYIIRFDYDQTEREEIYLCDQMSGVESFIEYLKSEIIKRKPECFKTFESNTNEDMMKLITRGEYDDYLDRKRESIDEKDMNIINKTIEKIKLINKFEIEIDKKFFDKPSGFSMIIPTVVINTPIPSSYKYKKGIACDIHKFIDEYYICSIYDVELKPSRKMDGYGKESWQEYDDEDGADYLCDQLIGLESFMSKLINDIKWAIKATATTNGNII